jgi:tetratricopeptide (TPR) repeat protein
VRYSALSLYDQSAPLFQARGLAQRARADYLAAGNPLAAAECLAAMGMHLKAAREMETLEFPEMEERIQKELFDHIRRGWGYDQGRVQELAREGEQLLARGEGRKALRRFRVLGETDGMLRALLGLKDDAEALRLLLEEGETKDTQRYIEARGQELEVPLTVLEGLVSRHERGGGWYVPDEEMKILVRLFTQSLSRQREATLPLLRRLFSLRQPYFGFDEEYPSELFSLLLEAKNYNAIFEILHWHDHRMEKPPQFLPPFLSKLENAVKKSGDANLLACVHYLRNQAAFDALVAELSVGPMNYKLVGASRRHYQRAVSWLLDRPQLSREELNQATFICRINRDFARSATIYEQRGLLAEAGRDYREAGLFEQALACYRKLDDEPNQARIYEKLGSWDQALEIWQRRGRTRDVQRVQKKKLQVKRRPAPKGEEENQRELF